MGQLTELAHRAMRAVLQPGEAAIDATAGNGRDTVFLKDCVGLHGRVFAFDIQSEAIARTTAAIGVAANVSLFQMDHGSMREAVPQELYGRIGAVAFNLGYLPGGDKELTTEVESTLEGVKSSLMLLRPGGILTVVAYTAHAGGAEEAEAIEELLTALLREEFEVQIVLGEPPRTNGAILNDPTSDGIGPRLFVVRKALAIP